jgi:PAS domain S-box-containing protein
MTKQLPDRVPEVLRGISSVRDGVGHDNGKREPGQSEERYRIHAMLSSDWYWEQDAQFRFTAFSGGARSGPWQAGQQAAIGKCRWELEGYIPLHSTWAAHRATLEARQSFKDFEILRSTPAHPTSYLSCSGEPLFDHAGRFTGYHGTARDITESKLAEQRLRETQALLHMAAQVGRLGAWALEVRQSRMKWSEEVCAIHEVKQGYQPTLDEAIAFFAAEYQDSMRGILQACMLDGSPFDVQAQIVTAKGRRTWVRVIGEAEWDAHGRVRRVQGACQDISDSKQAAEDARAMADQLTTTLESLTDAFFTVDRDWRFTYVNSEAERIMRRSRGELIGMEMWKAFPDVMDSVFAKHYGRAMRDNVALQFEAYYEPFGAWAQIKVYPSRQGLAIYAKDVSDLVQAQREILRLNAELEERVTQRTEQLEAANRELEAFSYSIAHDLRAPLSSIDGFSLMLQETAGAELAGRCRHYLSRIRAGVRQMGELTDGLLALTNLSRTSLRDEPVDLAVLARDVISTCREGAPERKVDARVAPALPVRGDPRLLSQVVGNLVGNAWKFTSRRDTAVIEVGCLPQAEGGPVYFVRDNGAGFDMAYASRMFEAFQRMHSSGDFEGTGIGLAIVQKIIARHDGRIWAESAPEQGATFYFTLRP